MANLERKRGGASAEYEVDGRTLSNGDSLELRMRGNRKWLAVEIKGLPKRLEVHWTADDGQALQATLAGLYPEWERLASGEGGVR